MLPPRVVYLRWTSEVFARTGSHKAVHCKKQEKGVPGMEGDALCMLEPGTQEREGGGREERKRRDEGLLYMFPGGGGRAHVLFLANVGMRVLFLEHVDDVTNLLATGA